MEGAKGATRKHTAAREHNNGITLNLNLNLAS